MWPWGHLAVGYLCYCAYSRFRLNRSPSVLPVVVLAVATQVPDLIDKPLAWTAGVLPNGRSLAHSLVLALPALALTRAALPEHRKRLFVPVVIGYLTHLATDAIYPVLTGRFHGAGFLGWPVIPPAEPSIDRSFLAHLTAMELTPWFTVQLFLVAVATVVWIVDGMPGLRTVRSIAAIGRTQVRETLW